jgi:hypothetical protein
MRPEDSEETPYPGFGPPWAGIADIFRQMHEEDESAPAREPARLDPRDLVVMHVWEARTAEWMALRAN